MNTFLIVTTTIIIINAFVCLYRVVKGPTVQDRILAINIVGSKTLIILVLMAAILQSSIYLDVAILLVLLNFILIVVISRYLEIHGRGIDQIDR